MVTIVVSSKQGGGKSTLCKKLREHFEKEGKRPFFSLRFAEPLYRMHDAIRSILRDYKYDNYDYDNKDGRLLQLLGTEWGRSQDQQRWVTLLQNQIRMLPSDAVAAIEDCRFENEFDSFTGMPGVLKVRLECNRQTRKFRCETTAGSNWRTDEHHASEVGLDQYASMNRFDMTINSDILNADDVFRMVLERVEVLLQNQKINLHGV